VQLKRTLGQRVVFCALHQVGFWNRAAMLDHLAGTHEFLLATVAYSCPDEAESCLFPAY